MDDDTQVSIPLSVSTFSYILVYAVLWVSKTSQKRKLETICPTVRLGSNFKSSHTPFKSTSISSISFDPAYSVWHDECHSIFPFLQSLYVQQDIFDAIHGIPKEQRKRRKKNASVRFRTI